MSLISGDLNIQGANDICDTAGCVIFTGGQSRALLSPIIRYKELKIVFRKWK